MDQPRVLVIEDDDFQRAVLCRMLRKAGVTDITEAEDGDRALALSGEARLPFQIAFCDLNMPNLDGMAMLSRLARMHPAPAVVLSSALEASLVRAVELMACELGFRVLGVLPKPPQFHRLVELLRIRRLREPRAVTAPPVDVSAAEVAQAVNSSRIVPYFQPKIRLRDGRPSGAEILARWPHPGHGVISPGVFLSHLRDSGGIERVTISLLEQALPVLKEARQPVPDFTLSLNVEAPSIARQRFCRDLFHTLEAGGCEPSWITLEVTESGALSSVALSLEHIARLRMQGFGLSIDDFGTGYSSLQQLSRLPFTELKLDRSFVHGAHSTPSKRIVADTSVDLARRMGLRAVAEGIEDQADLDLAVTAGFDDVQGFIFARPMPGNELIAWLERAKAAS